MLLNTQTTFAITTWRRKAKVGSESVRALPYIVNKKHNRVTVRVAISSIRRYLDRKVLAK